MMTSTERALTLAVATALAASPAAAQHGAPRPHIVFSMVDDLGWANVGWHNKDVLTPRSEALIAEGIQLDRNYTYPYCSPSRSSLMSGRLPYHVNQINLPGYYAGSGVARNMTMIPKKLKQAGYSTHMIGKTRHRQAWGGRRGKN